MAVDIPDSVAKRINLVRKVRIILLKHRFDITGSLAPAIERFEGWAETYRSLPDEETLCGKLVEFGVLQKMSTALLLIAELSNPSATEDAATPELTPGLDSSHLDETLSPPIRRSLAKVVQSLRLPAYATKRDLGLWDKLVLQMSERIFSGRIKKPKKP